MESSWEDPGNGGNGGPGGWEEPAPGVVRRRLPGWDATVGAVAGDDALLLVDAGATLGTGARLRRELAARFPVPLRHVVLTHPHFDHVLGAGALSGAEVHAAVGFSSLLSPAGRQQIAEDAVRHGLAREAAEQAAEALPVPRHEVSGELVVPLGGGRRAVLLNAGPAHTAHDLAVLVPGDGAGPDVVFCGDLVEESGEPQAGPDAHRAWWPAALDRLLDLGGPDARYVPGHGAVVDAAFVRAQRDALARRFRV
ncbi:MBL fold metallo-hydrolase [Streptomyces aidingensis]|uniref:Glyoxylase, beta-lactamase superfamily II n=1 Tax=Streptomyces aidingensis TaxID=910347 RepID=A0A1I1FT97_9ACTN|nr:MBL fold metallo-hydrolase [Streptomyces aidingensis]SFC00293.1 Glyoxylase, beta-lactamase superfamily II [Streptomyces aidingensis]